MPLCLGENGNCASLPTLTDFFCNKNPENPLKRLIDWQNSLKTYDSEALLRFADRSVLQLDFNINTRR
jgi:hypothetical protein